MNYSIAPHSLSTWITDHTRNVYTIVYVYLRFFFYFVTSMFTREMLAVDCQPDYYGHIYARLAKPYDAARRGLIFRARIKHGARTRIERKEQPDSLAAIVPHCPALYSTGIIIGANRAREKERERIYFSFSNPPINGSREFRDGEQRDLNPKLVCHQHAPLHLSSFPVAARILFLLSRVIIYLLGDVCRFRF